MTTRRDFFKFASLAGGAVATASVSSVTLASLPELVTQHSSDTATPLTPPNGLPYRPVVTLNGWSLPWRMNQGVKEFHLVAEEVQRELAPNMVAKLWGYNGQSPGPTIEVVEGDKVRIFVTNRLPEHTSIHWHGQRLPNGMDGVSGLTQAAIPSGKTCVYEFTARRSGTFMYHPHADEMLQMAMGMYGMWITHPKSHALPTHYQAVDRDFCFLLNAFDIEPGSRVPKPSTMLDFNLWAWNSRVFPGIDSLNVRLGDRVRIRVGNLTMTNHPIHIHGMEFEVTGTDGGWIPHSARWPEVTTDIAVGQMRCLEFTANEEGDWAIHCHKSHHTMNAMGHGLPNMIGVNQDDIAEKINDVIPNYMSMGETGMSEMGMMAEHMDIPSNTLPMMTGTGPYGSLEMGGMFSVLKVRKNQKPNDYRDYGWYQQPKGTQARLINTNDKSQPRIHRPTKKIETDETLIVKKPTHHSH